MEQLAILELSFVMGHGDDQHVKDTLHVSLDDVLASKDLAMDVIKQRAEEVASGQSVQRITYQDDEGDWCTINCDTLGDALEFAAPSDGSLRRLVLRVVPAQAQTMKLEGRALEEVAAMAMEDAAALKAARETVANEDSERRTQQEREQPQKEAEATQGDPTAQTASLLERALLSEVNRLVSAADARVVIPRLATAALGVVEELQSPTLYPLIQPLCDFQEGKLEADAVPKMLPEFLKVVSEVPADDLRTGLGRLKQEAEKVVAQLKMELQRGCSKGAEVEVHHNVICDVCEKMIMGPRFKSLEAEDYDLCKVCYDAEAREAAKWARVKSEVFGTVVSSYYGEAARPGEAAVHHGIVCDMCKMSPIVGKRYRCLDLEDYDVCAVCLARSEAIPETAARRFEEVAALSMEDAAALRAFSAAEETAAQEERERQTREAELAALVQAATERVATLEGGEARGVLLELLAHQNDAVRAAVRAAIQPRAAAEQEASQQPQVSPAVVPEPVVSQRTPDVQDEDAVPVEEDVVTVVEEKAPQVSASPAMPSAVVLARTDLTLGVEAQEDAGACGDASGEFAQLVQQAGAKQAFRIGRVVVPINLAQPVPICAKVVVRNDGQVPWPATTVITIAAGDAMGFTLLPLGSMGPGEAAEVVMDLLLPAIPQACASRSVWALIDGATGQPLGPLIFFEGVWA